MRGGAQKPRLGGHISAPSYKKIDLKIKGLIFSLILSLFNCFHFILHTAIFLRKIRCNLKLGESGSSKTWVGGHFSAPSYEKNWFKNKKFDFFTNFVSFQLFPFYLAHGFFWETLGIIWGWVRGGAQKPRLGGHFLAQSYKKFDLNIKNVIFSLILSLFKCFHFILHRAIFLRNIRPNLRVGESRSSKT